MQTNPIQLSLPQVAAAPSRQRRRIGGWWRLWVLLLVVYGAALAGYATWRWPLISGVAHRPEYVQQMSPQAQAVLDRPPARPFGDLVDALSQADGAAVQEKAQRLAQTVYDRIRDPSWAALGNTALVMENGHRFEVASETGSEDAALVTREYERVIDRELLQRRAAFALRLLAIWLIPLLVICGFGLMIQWVQRGFAETESLTKA